MSNILIMILLLAKTAVVAAASNAADVIDLTETQFEKINVSLRLRIPTVKLKIPGKSRIQKFYHIQVIVFDLSYLPVAAVGT